MRSLLVLLPFAIGALPLSAKTTPAKPDITGTWKSEVCESFPNADGSKTYYTRTFINDQARWSIDFSTFGSDSCAAAAKLLTVHIEGPYRIGKVSTKVPGATEADFDFDKRAVTPHNAGALSWLNAQKVCGYSDWKVGQAKDIQQNGCLPLGSHPISTCKGEKDLVKVDGNKLWFGKRPADSDLCTEGKRPQALSAVAVLKN